MAPAYVDRILPRGHVRLRTLFDVDRMHDPEAYARVCTLEYLFERLGVDL